MEVAALLFLAWLGSGAVWALKVSARNENNSEQLRACHDHDIDIEHERSFYVEEPYAVTIPDQYSMTTPLVHISLSPLREDRLRRSCGLQTMWRLPLDRLTDDQVEAIISNCLERDRDGPLRVNYFTGHSDRNGASCDNNLLVDYVEGGYAVFLGELFDEEQSLALLRTPADYVMIQSHGGRNGIQLNGNVDLNREEIAGLRWFTIDELQQQFIEAGVVPETETHNSDRIQKLIDYLTDAGLIIGRYCPERSFMLLSGFYGLNERQFIEIIRRVERDFLTYAESCAGCEGYEPPRFTDEQLGSLYNLINLREQERSPETVIVEACSVGGGRNTQDNFVNALAMAWRRAVVAGADSMSNGVSHLYSPSAGFDNLRIRCPGGTDCTYITTADDFFPANPFEASSPEEIRENVNSLLRFEYAYPDDFRSVLRVAFAVQPEVNQLMLLEIISGRDWNNRRDLLGRILLEAMRSGHEQVQCLAMLIAGREYIRGEPLQNILEAGSESTHENVRFRALELASEKLNSDGLLGIVTNVLSLGEYEDYPNEAVRSAMLRLSHDRNPRIRAWSLECIFRNCSLRQIEEIISDMNLNDMLPVELEPLLERFSEEQFFEFIGNRMRHRQFNFLFPVINGRLFNRIFEEFMRISGSNADSLPFFRSFLDSPQTYQDTERFARLIQRLIQIGGEDAAGMVSSFAFAWSVPEEIEYFGLTLSGIEEIEMETLRQIEDSDFSDQELLRALRSVPGSLFPSVRRRALQIISERRIEGAEELVRRINSGEEFLNP